MRQRGAVGRNAGFAVGKVLQFGVRYFGFQVRQRFRERLHEIEFEAVITSAANAVGPARRSRHVGRRVYISGSGSTAGLGMKRRAMYSLALHRHVLQRISSLALDLDTTAPLSRVSADVGELARVRDRIHRWITDARVGRVVALIGTVWPVRSKARARHGAAHLQ